MAASMRLRLHFDGSICTQLSPRKCWFLANLDNCNVVADLEYLIRERFQLDRGLNIHLYLDDFLLPSMENIYVVRDNDTLWVKLSEIKDHLPERLDVSPTPSSEPNANEESLSKPERQQKKRSKSKTKKRKTSFRSPETSNRKHKSRKLDNSLAQKKVGTDGARVQNKTNEWRCKTKVTGGKTKERDDHPVDRDKRAPEHHTELVDTVETCTTLKSKTAGFQHRRKKTVKEPPKQDSLATTLKSARKAQRSTQAVTANEGATASPSDSSVSPKHKRSDSVTRSSVVRDSENVSTCSDLTGALSGKSANSSKSRHRPSLEMSNGGVEESAKRDNLTTLSGAMSKGPAPKTTDAVTSGGSHSGIGKATATDQSSSDGRKLLNGPRKKPFCPSAGHIRFESESESESESDSDSSTEHSGLANEEARPSVQDEQIHSQITSENSAANLPPSADQPSTENATATLESVPGLTGSDILELQPPPPGQIPSEGQFQRNGSPYTRGASGARGRGFARGKSGNWDKKSQLAEVSSNKSVIIQNTPAVPAPPPKDFTSFPSLVGPPRQGDIIAYKILELSESYCPELSDFKEAKVSSVDVPSGQLEVELVSVAMATKPPKLGKFDLQWEDHEECQDVFSENTSVDLTVLLQLRDLVDARLVPPTSS